jgi:hypothetical protein
MATTLEPGDVAIVHYASDDPDAFALVFLRDIEAGTTINITNKGWLAAGGFHPSGGTTTYTAPADITAGTVITVPIGSIALDTAGDQLIVYQGTEASPTLLYAIDFADGNNTFAADAISSTTSALPTGLTLGVTALALGSDNAVYAGPTSGTSLDLLEAIGDRTHWTGDDIVPQPRGADLVTFDRPFIDLDFDNSTHFGRDYETSVVRGGPGVQIADTDVRVEEGSGLFLTSVTIRVVSPDFGDLLSVNGSLPFGITASSYSPLTGSLTLSGLATSSAYETAIRQVEFSTTSGILGGTKRLQVTAYDGADASFEANAFIDILVAAAAAAPALDLDANNSNGGGADYTATYTAGGPGTPIADIDVAITDADSAILQSATITILSWALQPGDVLSIAGSLPSGIMASSFNPVTGVITLSGAASLADYQTALRQVVYSSTNPTPSTGDRGIQVVVNDGGLDSNIATTYMHVVIPPPNVAPVLNLDADSSTTGGFDYLTTFTDGGPPVAIADTDTLILDSDSPQLASATITLTNPQADDVLVFNGAPPAGISVSGSGTSAITFTGSASRAAYETALEQITFDNTGTNPTSDTRVIDVVVNDGTANSNTAHAIIEVTEVNNSAPVLDLDADNATAPGTTWRGTFTENGLPVPIAGDTLITDADSANLASATITLTNPKAGDLLTVLGPLPAGIEASTYDPVTGVLTLTTVSGPRTLADYETALEQIRFSAVGDNPVGGTRIIEVVVSDGVNDGDTATALISVAAVNDAPAIAVDPSATYVEGGASVVLSPSVILADPDSSELSFAVVRITAGSFAGDGDELSILGSTSGVLGGITWEWDPASHSLVLTGAATASAYQSLLQSVDFKSLGDNPTDYNASPARTLSWTVSDGTTQTTTSSLLDISARNDRPIVTVAALASYSENGAPIVVSPAAIATDADNLQLGAGQVTITAGAFAGDLLTVNGLESGTFAGINFSYDPVLHSLLFSLAAPIADYQAFLQAVQFHSISDDPTNGGANPARTLSWTLFDGRDVSTAQSTTLSITASNDAPVNLVPGAQNVDQDTVLPIAGLSVADPDTDSGFQIELTVLAGTLAVPTAGGVSVIGNGTDTVQLSGTLVEVNAALAGLQYLGDAGFAGADTLTVLSDDGSGGTDTDTIAIAVNPTNGAPVNTVPGAQVASEDASFPISGVSVTDPDGDTLTAILTVANGILTVAAGPGVAGNGTASVTITGTVAEINTALAGLSYQGNLDFNGPDTLTVQTSDGALTDTDTVAIAVNPVNDAPVNTVPGPQVGEANTDVVLGGLSISDVDAAAGTITTTLSVTNGTLTVLVTGGATVSGNGTALVTISGVLPAVTSLTASGNVVYHGALDFFGTDTLTMTTNDGGNTGGAGLTDTDQVIIRLNAHLVGTPDADSFTALPGNERIDALHGIDTVAFGFRLVDATVTYRGNEVIIDGPSGSHTVLTGFETFVFTDGTVDNNDGNWLVDDLFYYSGNHDVWNARVDADDHYATFGWHEGRDPSAFFSTVLYLSTNPDVAAAGVNPLDHWHELGWTEARVPSRDFGAPEYLAANPDVAAANIDPLQHFLMVGAGELRDPFPPGTLSAPNGFDYVYYLHHNPDVAAAGIDPFWHYQTVGWQEGRDPNAWFDTRGYLATYTDVAAAGINPLDHYHQSGWGEGRDPSTGFDTESYLAANPDVARAGIDPLEHYLRFGAHEGRSTFADGVWG